MWTSIPAPPGMRLLYRKTAKISSLFPLFRKNLWEFSCRERSGQPVCKRGFSTRREHGVPARRRKGREGRRVIHRVFHRVEEVILFFDRRWIKLKSRAKCDIMGSMKEKAPDFGRCRALYEENADRFAAFAALLTAYNARFNLTSVTEEREIRFKHFYDSLAGEFLLPEGARAAEVGSGGGFPSVPLMIARPDLSFTLIESTGKKCEFLGVVIRELGLRAEVVNARAEDVGRDPRYREKFDVCCARAVARLDTLAEYCMPLVRTGGQFIAYKGGMPETDIASRAISLLGGGEAEVIRYALWEGFGARCLVAVPKVKRTPPQYPRGNGAERRKPL